MKKIKVAILGYGRTGKVVVESFQQDSHFDLMFVAREHPSVKNSHSYPIVSSRKLENYIHRYKPSIIVDFTTPKATLENISRLLPEMGVVIATTGFTQLQLSNLKKRTDLKILYAPNISDGINILIHACKLINRLWDRADVEIIEQHHKHKKDAPSGTAKKIAAAMDHTSAIHSVRAGGIVGIHEVIFGMSNQKIVINHTSFSRRVFAEGAKRAVRWLDSQDVGFYEVGEMYE